MKPGGSPDVCLGNLKLDVSSSRHFSNQKEQSELDKCEASKFVFPSRPRINYKPTENDSDAIEAFDVNVGINWQYPSDFEFRTYQFVITERCLYQNCLVCIPTGLGKTFIAAVVMHNFLRWYPTGKVVFMAPTRPLVSQQMQACRKFTSMSQCIFTELTGAISPNQRSIMWNQFRAFFLTPQVIVNDLISGICPASTICCIVIDEAHKATGNHAYCQVIRTVTSPPYNHRLFRVVALTATPAADLVGAQAVIANLLISHLEIRTEECDDIKLYSHQREVETIVVHLDSQLVLFKTRLCDIAAGPLQRLISNGALQSRGICNGNKCLVDPETISKFALVKAREEFSQDVHARYTPIAGMVHRDFRAAICFAHAIQLLIQYGLRSLYHFLLSNLKTTERSILSTELSQIAGVREFVVDLAAIFGSSVSGDCANTLPDAIHSQAPFVAGHPKFIKLRDILLEHFSTCENRDLTRAIVFTQFRDSVMEIMHLLKPNTPLLRPAVFVGQSSVGKKATTQRSQLCALNAFRSGRVNILVSTCVGEEGLDVGQVDLIVCFDAYKSPVRLLQRLGRTGRKRDGRVVMLLTEGQEHSNYMLSKARSSTVHQSLLRGQAHRQLSFYPHNPRMVPLCFDPIPIAWVSAVEKNPEICQTGTGCKRQRIDDFFASPIRSLKEAILDHFATHDLGSSVLQLSAATHLPLFSMGARPTPLANQCSSLVSLRDGFQSGGKTPTGPSTATWHLVSLLQLIELHRHDLTHIMYHATGLRSLDPSKFLSDIIPQSTQTLDELSTPIVPLVSSIKPSPSCQFIRGLISQTLFMDPLVTIVPELDTGVKCADILITADGLNKSLANLLKDAKPTANGNNTSKLFSDFDIALDAEDFFGMSLSDEEPTGTSRNTSRFEILRPSIAPTTTCPTVNIPPQQHASIIFDSAFGLPLPIVRSSTPFPSKALPRVVCSPSFGGFDRPGCSAVSDESSNTLLNAPQKLNFNSHLLFDQDFSDILKPTQG